jgi:hypothetical protein
MPSRYPMLMRWLIALLLLLGFAWSLNLSLFDWWASSGPPVEHPEVYRMRGNIFFGISCGLLLGLVFAVRSLIRGKGRQGPQ